MPKGTFPSEQQIQDLYNEYTQEEFRNWDQWYCQEDDSKKTLLPYSHYACTQETDHCSSVNNEDKGGSIFSVPAYFPTYNYTCFDKCIDNCRDPMYTCDGCYNDRMACAASCALCDIGMQYSCGPTMPFNICQAMHDDLEKCSTDPSEGTPLDIKNLVDVCRKLSPFRPPVADDDDEYLGPVVPKPLDDYDEYIMGCAASIAYCSLLHNQKTHPEGAYPCDDEKYPSFCKGFRSMECTSSTVVPSDLAKGKGCVGKSAIPLDGKNTTECLQSCSDHKTEAGSGCCEFADGQCNWFDDGIALPNPSPDASSTQAASWQVS